MKIGKILYDGSEKGYQISIAETRKVTDLLEKNELFEKGIIYLRDKYKIPANGYSFEKDLGTEEWLFDHKGFDLSYFFDDSEVLTKELNLPPYWYSSIAYFAMFNVFFTPERIPIETKYLKFKDNYLTGTHVVVKEKMSKTELHKWIDEAWEDIAKEMESLPKVKGHKMFRSEIAKEIVRLRDEEKKSYEEIAQALGEKYANNELFNILNEDYVKILYYRWKKIIGLKK